MEDFEGDLTVAIEGDNRKDEIGSINESDEEIGRRIHYTGNIIADYYVSSRSRQKPKN